MTYSGKKQDIYVYFIMCYNIKCITLYYVRIMSPVLCCILFRWSLPVLVLASCIAITFVRVSLRKAPASTAFVWVSLRKAPAFVSNFNKASP